MTFGARSFPTSWTPAPTFRRSEGSSQLQAGVLSEMGLVLEALEDWPGGERHYGQAREKARTANGPSHEYEAVAGLARCALAQGRLEEARQLALETWEYLNRHGPLNMEHPMRPYGLCAEVFDALGEGEVSRAVVEAGYRMLLTNADKIGNPEWRESFLQNDPFNRKVVERWERGH